MHSRIVRCRTSRGIKCSVLAQDCKCLLLAIRGFNCNYSATKLKLTGIILSFILRHAHFDQVGDDIALQISFIWRKHLPYPARNATVRVKAARRFSRHCKLDVVKSSTLEFFYGVIHLLAFCKGTQDYRPYNHCHIFSPFGIWRGRYAAASTRFLLLCLLLTVIGALAPASLQYAYLTRPFGLAACFTY